MDFPRVVFNFLRMCRYKATSAAAANRPGGQNRPCGRIRPRRAQPFNIRRAFKIFRRKDDIAVGFIDLGEKIINGAKARFEAPIAAQFPRNVVVAGKGTGDAGFWIEKSMLRQLSAIIIQLNLDCCRTGLVGADMKKAFAHGPPVGDGPWWCTHGSR